MSPSEWRNMSPSEGMRLMDTRRSPTTIGGLSEADYDNCEDRRAKLESEGVKVL